MDTLYELVAIRDGIDRILAKDPSLVVQAELYSSRIFALRAIREQAAGELSHCAPMVESAEKRIEA